MPLGWGRPHHHRERSAAIQRSRRLRLPAPSVVADVAGDANSLGDPLDLWIAALRSR
jgi:hypothetical protein